MSSLASPSSSSSSGGKTTDKGNNAGGGSSSSNIVLWITYINIVLYALSYQIQRPVEPYLIQQLTEQQSASDGGSSSSSANDVAQNYGNLQSFFSFCQFFGSPIVGVLLDRIGIRMTSCIVFGASALSYALLSQARDLRMLFLSKIPTIFQAAFLVAQATAATATHNDTALRAAALGRMTTAYTVGATIGPALGGYLAESGDFYQSAKLAVVGSLLSVVLSLLFLPNRSTSSSSENDNPSTPGTTTTTTSNDNHNNNKKRSSALKRSKSSFVDDLKDSISIALRPNIWPLLMVKVLGGVTASMHSTALPLVLTQTLGLEPTQLGYSMSASMFAVAAFGAVAMAPLTSWLGSFGMMNVGLLSRCGLGLAIAAIVTISTDNSDATLMKIVTVSVLYSLSQHVLATGLTTQTTGSVDKDEQGALLGLEHSLFSLARIGGPAMGTTLLAAGGLWMVETACGSLDVLLAGSLAVALPKASRRTKSS